MTKKSILLVVSFLILLCGCNNTKPNAKNWKLDAQYNSVYTDGWKKGVISNTENGIISYCEVETQDALKYFPLYIDNDGVYSMDTNISSTCSYTNPDKCENLIPHAHGGIDYYKGKLYYIDFIINEEFTGYQISLNESDVNGYNQRKICTLIEYISFDDVDGSVYSEFHRNKAYVNLFGKLYMIDLLTNEFKTIEIPGVEKIWRIFFDNEKMYITTEEYNDSSKLHFDAILECDLEGNFKSLAYDNLCTMLIDENLIFYRNREDLTWHIYNRKTDEKWQINDTLYYYVLKYEDTYLLETINMLTDTFEMTILDSEGKIIHTKDYTNDTYYNGGLLYVGNKYYVCIVGLDDKIQGYGYYEITDKGISDLIKIPFIEE